jgi:hypothetical protein
MYKKTTREKYTYVFQGARETLRQREIIKKKTG